MRKYSRILILFSLLIGYITLEAQVDEGISKGEVNGVLVKAEESFAAGNYIDALFDFKRLYNYDRENAYYKLMTGICYIYEPELKEKSMPLLEEVKRENPKQRLINYYLGRSYAANYKFDKAISHFNMFIDNSTAEDDKEKEIAERMIKNCKNAKSILSDTIVEDKITNLDYPINTQYSEYVPVISGDGLVMIYTYRGIKSKGANRVEESMASIDYDEDILVSYKENGKWTEPVSIGDNINTKTHDAAIGLSVDGQTLFLYKGNYSSSGDIYMSQLVGDEWGKPSKLTGDVNTDDSWEGSCSLDPSGKVLYFSSDREGGLGGRDLYKSALQVDGSWGTAENLGPTVNTVYNDDAPFIHSDGKTLYYSSEGHSSIGGYDVFYSVLDKKTGAFGEAVNMGCPINTINDNRYFVLSADGRTGYYSADGDGSIGEHDIFKITRGNVDKPLLALLLGKVYLDDVETGAYMSVYKKGQEEDLAGAFKANEETGKYLMALAPGMYQIETQLITGEIALDSVDFTDLRDYIELRKDFRIYSDSSKMMNSNILRIARQNVANSKTTSINVSVIQKENSLFKEELDALFDKKEVKKEIEISEIKDLKTIGVGKEITLRNILYDFDRATLRPESVKELENLLRILKENPTAKVEISSHTDSWGPDAYNLNLSQARAKAVTDYLIGKGIEKNRLVAKGYGESKPKVRNDNIAHRQLNRRTEFKVLGFMY